MITTLALMLAAAPVQSSDSADLARAERQMNLQFELAIERLQNCKANTTKCYYWHVAIPRLQKEQTAWKAWRDAKSDLDAVEMEGTSGEANYRNYLKARVTKARATELSKIGRD